MLLKLDSGCVQNAGLHPQHLKNTPIPSYTQTRVFWERSFLSSILSYGHGMAAASLQFGSLILSLSIIKIM